MRDDDDDLIGSRSQADGLAGHHEVGYGRPPEATRFKPGQSGNPNGRPRGTKTRRISGQGYELWDLLKKEAERLVPAREGGQEISVPQLQAVVRQIHIKAMQGNMRAAELLMKHVAAEQRAERRLHERYLEEIFAYRARAEAEVHRREALGITDMSDILPHPDHIGVDFNTGEVLINGPMTPREKAEVDALHAELERRRQLLARCNELDPEGFSKAPRKGIEEMRLALENQVRELCELLGEPFP